MCDENFENDLKEFQRRTGAMTRRQFGAVSMGVGLTMLLPRAADALDVTEMDVEIQTPDGKADCYFVHPASGRHPGVLIWPDALGLRPAFRQMGKRLAEAGYSVLVVNPYYRSERAPILPEGASFADESTRNKIMPLMGSLNAQTHVTDARAFVAYLDAQAAVDTSRKIGTTGYCMGGPITMRTAAALPDRIGAAASFHGGGLVAEGPESPHLLVPKMKASYLFAIAANDDERQPEAKDVLRDSFAKAGLPAEIEVYTGTMHGWCPPDSAVYDEGQAEHAWSRLLVLFDKALA
ncbi:MAG: dienelactone hydrolase family protein [Gammaproteobacteria bacterium]|nr:dienelactone hydrolase family protein [Gammaproteobacteria bacterium]